MNAAEVPAVEASGAGEGRRRRRTLMHLVTLGLFLLALGLWLVHTRTHPALLDRDWVAFDRAGWRALGGNWSSVYAASAEERWPYLYPPVALLLSLPLGMLPYWPSYLMAVAMGVVGTWWSCRCLGAVLGPAAGRTALFTSALLCAPSTLSVFITGQYSWLYLMALTGMVAAHGRGDDRRAGWSLALLAVKPNIGLMFLPLLLLRRRWATLRHAALACAVALLVTAPLALTAWPRFLGAVQAVAARQEAGEAPTEKQVTVLAFLRVLSGHREATALTWSLWLVVAATSGAALLWAWGRADQRVSELRMVGMGALAVVALSPRLYFYDGLLAAVPAAVWYLEADRYGRRAYRRAEGVCLAGVVVVSALFFRWPQVGTAFGPLAAAWLGFECLDTRAVLRRPGPARPGGAPGGFRGAGGELAPPVVATAPAPAVPAR